MEASTRNNITALVVLLVVALVGVWYWYSAGAPGANIGAQTAANGSSASSYSNTNPLVVHHALANPPPIKGAALGKMNTYSGAVPAISSCDQIQANLSPVSGTTNHFTLTLTIKNPNSCAAASAGDTTPFSAGVALKDASQTPVVDGVIINGVPTPFKLVEEK